MFQIEQGSKKIDNARSITNNNSICKGLETKRYMTIVCQACETC